MNNKASSSMSVSDNLLFVFLAPNLIPLKDGEKSSGALTCTPVIPLFNEGKAHESRCHALILGTLG